ncbi:MAG: class II aldolase/adducin family protein [Candidatus Bathyarchaeia archaeon]
MKPVSSKRNNAELRLRQEICRVGKAMNASGLCAFLGVYAPGNLSARLPGSDRIIISPSGLDKGSLKPGDLVVVDLNGQRVEGKYNFSTETPTHCAIYRKRPDVNAVVHAHSPGCLAFAVAHQEIPATTIELAAVSGARVPLAKYATPGTEALAVATVEALGHSDAVIMANHGIAAVGATLDEAFNNALSVEFTARININAKMLGGVAELPANEVSGIRDYVLKKYGQK